MNPLSAVLKQSIEDKPGSAEELGAIRELRLEVLWALTTIGSRSYPNCMELVDKAGVISAAMQFLRQQCGSSGSKEGEFAGIDHVGVVGCWPIFAARALCGATASFIRRDTSSHSIDCC